MKYYLRPLQFLFPSVMWQTTSKGIHLTFDDGPHHLATPKVLHILHERGIQATFFVIGLNTYKYPDIASQIYSEGHSIGNHSYTHTCLLFKSKNFIKKEILQTEEIIEATIGKRSHLFRPPFGYFNRAMLNVVRELDSTCVLWSSDSKDFRMNTSHNFERRLIRKITNGSILLFHDNDHTVNRLHIYLPRILDSLLAMGFAFTPLPL